MQKSASIPIWPIAAILSIATALRLTGYNWGLPFIFHPDEDRILDGAWKAYWGFDAWESDYGMLPMRSIAMVWKLAGIFNPDFAQAPTGPDHFSASMSMARILAAGFGIATVALVYFKSLHFFSWQIGAFAAAILALSPLHIQLSHFITVDIFLVFFVSLTFFYLLEYLQNPRRSSAWMLGTSIGLMLSCKLSALPMLPICIGLVIVAGYRTSRTSARRWSLLLDPIILIAAATGIYLWIQPEAMHPAQYFLLDPTDPLWWHAFNFPQGSHKFEWNLLMSRGLFEPLWTLASRLELHQICANLLWGIGLPAVAALGSIIILHRGMSRIQLLALALSLSALSASFLQSRIFFLRYAGPILPFVAMMAAFFFHHIQSQKKSLMKIAITGCGIMALIHAAAISSIYIQPDSRQTVGQWIAENLPRGSTICVEEEPFATILADISNFSFSVMPIYKWDMTMRRQIPDHGMNHPLVKGRYSEFPELWSEEVSRANIQEVTDQCQYFVISDRIWDQVLKMPPAHPLRILYDNLLDPSKGSVELQHIQVRPQFFGITLNDQWTEHTVRIFDHPQFRIIQNSMGVAAL